MGAVTEEQAKLKKFYDDLCTYFSSQTGYGPDAYVDYEDAKIAWDGFRSCIASVKSQAVFPLEEYQRLKQDEGALNSIIERELCHDLAEYFMRNLASEYKVCEITDSYKNIVFSIRFNFINPNKLKEVEL